MLVTRDKFDSTLSLLSTHGKLSLDTETYGLRSFHGDQIFSIIIGCSSKDAYYFNFHYYENCKKEIILDREHFGRMGVLFNDRSKTWAIQNAKFDMHMLKAWGVELAGEIWCTRAMGRIEYNEHFSYSLDASLKRIGLAKDDKVKKWIDDNEAYEKSTRPGKKTIDKKPLYSRVPFDIIVPYGLDDARGCYALMEKEEKSIETQSSNFPRGVPSLQDAAYIERRLTKTVFRMEHVGVKIDRKYCERAIKYEEDRVLKAASSFEIETGRSYSASPLLFKDIFNSERHKWVYTEKGNPSFESDVIKKFESPAAKAILILRNAKSKLDFYNGFIWHADSNDIIHPNLSPDGTRTFRFSSSEPNLQNLTSEEGMEDQEFLVRRAFVPRPGFVFGVLDFKSMEYRQMLDLAKHMQVKAFEIKGLTWEEDYFSVVNKVLDGMDIHQATADLMGVTRGEAKTLNFMLLYGGGAQKLADALGIGLDAAVVLRSKYFRAMPYVQDMISRVSRVVKERGWIRNWAGYKFHFPNREHSYMACNTLIQSGCAAILKVGMNRIDDYLIDKPEKLLLCVHDELVLEVREDNPQIFRDVVKLAEDVYPHHYLPMKCSSYIGKKSYADLEEFS